MTVITMSRNELRRLRVLIDVADGSRRRPCAVDDPARLMLFYFEQTENMDAQMVPLLRPGSRISGRAIS